jgi:medium-chain acyl-[acyl-carrier-protein] hydrolase
MNGTSVDGMVTATQDVGRNPWIIRRRSTVGPRVRLFCFPYAGGGTLTFRSWPQTLPADVELCAVQLPGREQRLREPLVRNAVDMIDMIVPALRGHIDRPFALFGHSMGAVLAYEVARRLLAESGQEPQRLFVSGHRAPHLAPNKPPIHNMTDAAFIAEVMALNGTPPELFAHAELVECVLPILRADFELIETYTEMPGPCLSCPVIALGGDADVDVPHAEIVAWHKMTTGRFKVAMVPGGHFYINTARERVLQILLGELSNYGA